MLFAVVGLPFMYRYLPYIRGPHDVSDPTKDETLKPGYESPAKETKKVPLWKRWIQVYCVCLLASFVITGIYFLVVR